MTWHIPEDTLRAYVAERIPDADAWSVEAHLVSCESCRRHVGSIGRDTSAAADPMVDAVWRRVAADLSAQGTIRPVRRWRGIFVLAASGASARGAWLLAIAAVLGVAVVLDLSGSRVGAAGGGVDWLTLLAPLIPVVGVGAAYGTGLDDAHEIIASTPSGGLRLLLARTVAVLAVAVPASLIVGVLTTTGAVGWLVPSLALTSLTLAAGSFLGIVAAASVVGCAWATVVIAPTLVSAMAPMGAAIDRTSVWMVIGVASAVAVVARRSSFSRPAVLPNPRTEP